jgi:hypothetical protein
VELLQTQLTRGLTTCVQNGGKDVGSPEFRAVLRSWAFDIEPHVRCLLSCQPDPDIVVAQRFGADALQYWENTPFSIYAAKVNFDTANQPSFIETYIAWLKTVSRA